VPAKRYSPKLAPLRAGEHRESIVIKAEDTVASVAVDRNRAMGLSDAVARFPPHPSFRGWRVVAGAFTTSMVGFGAIYSYGAFAKTLAGTFELSSASTSMIIALSIGTTFFASALSGLFSDRIGPRRLAVAGMLITGLGLLLAAEATTALQIYLCYGVLLGLGTGLAYVPASAAVQRWFIAWRGLASGIAAAGVGVGTILVPPLTRLFSSFGDWRLTFMIFGIGAAVLGTVGALLLSASPERDGLLPDGRITTSAESGVPLLPGPSLREATRSPSFAWFYCGVLLTSLLPPLPFAHLVESGLENGLGADQAMMLISILGVGSVAGRFLYGGIADWIGRRLAFLSCCLGMAAATMLWARADDVLLYVFSLIFGGFYGGFVAMLPAFTVDNFGRRCAPGIIGLVYTSRAFAGLVGPPVVAAVAAISGGFGMPLLATTAVAGVGCVLLTRVRPIENELRNWSFISLNGSQKTMVLKHFQHGTLIGRKSHV
jgi:MFS family permease